MNFIPTQIAFFLHQHSVRRNLVILGRFLLMLIALVLLFSFIFHLLMLHEGQNYSFLTGIYWTLTVMSTLGFGDITFTSDTGKLFTIVVLVSGILFFMVILPFAFIQYFYAPWVKAMEKGHIPRKAPADLSGHVIIASTTPIALNLADELKDYGAQCLILCSETQRTLDLRDQGYEAYFGSHDVAETYSNLRLEDAAMLVTLENDVRNTNVIFTARDVSPAVSIVSSAQNEDGIDILRLAGASRVFQFYKLLGEALARRVLNVNMRFSIVNRYRELVVAEGPVMRTPLVGKSLRESDMRAVTGANVVGLWERGKFVLPTPDTVFTSTMVMVIAGDMQQIQAANTFLGKGSSKQDGEEAPVVIIGSGRVGMVAALQLKRSDRKYCVVDKNPRYRFSGENLVIGDASDREILNEAGIKEAQSVIITTHDDDTNIYLTLYCRRLREDIQIISRATLDRNVGILHSAGADLVLSLASMVSSSIINLLAPGKLMMINEGLNIFRFVVGKELAGKQLMGSGIRKDTHCSVVAVREQAGSLRVNPLPTHIFQEGEEIFLIGDSASEKSFYEKFGKNQTLN